MSSVTEQRVCIIGAGTCGIAAAKSLRRRGIAFDCFEARPRVGGLWAISEGDVQASYRSLECNTSKLRTQFSDFPMPRSYPAYPHNTQMAAYFESYVDHFGLRDSITLNTRVLHARRADGGWDVSVEPGGTRHYSALIVASGHHREPRWPQPPFAGEFAGREMHAHDYVGPEGFEGQSVVVLGMGNSAMDIAVELSGVARVHLASRRGAHIIPKYVMGLPIDLFNTPMPLPWSVKRALFNLIVRSTIGRPESAGMLKPDHKLGEAHPTVSQRIVDRVRRGTVIAKPNIAGFSGSTVRFSDGSEVSADTVVYCTGYNVTFPFLDPEVISVADNRVDLFHQVFLPDVAHLAFIGLAQPFGALIPLAEAQSEWVGDYVAGRYTLPPAGAMRAQIRRARDERERQFVASARHTMEIDLYAYLRGLRRERRRGASEPVVAVGSNPARVHGVDAAQPVGGRVDGGGEG